MKPASLPMYLPYRKSTMICAADLRTLKNWIYSYSSSLCPLHLKCEDKYEDLVPIHSQLLAPIPRKLKVQ